MVGRSTMKKVGCCTPGLGAPLSLYYFCTGSEKCRADAKKGFFILGASVIVLSLSPMIAFPSGLLLLASVYLYWAVLGLAASWGFIVLYFGYKVFTRSTIATKVKLDNNSLLSNDQHPNPAPLQTDSYPKEVLLKEIEKLPRDERMTIIQKMYELSK